MTTSAQFLRKKIRGGSIDVHPIEKALIVHYETEAAILGEHGDPMIGDKKKCQKMNLDKRTDVADLAKRIVESCHLIQPSKLSEVEHLLRYLLHRKPNKSENAQLTTNVSKLADPGAFDSAEIDETAHMTDIDDYLELFYEDTSEKLRASALILQLARNPDNLEEIYQNEILVGAIARVLREDWKKSTDLATNLVYIFFCFSSFSSFHSVIHHFKIGSLTMAILEHELQKYALWTSEINAKMSEYGESSQEFKSSQKKFEVLIRKQEQLFRVSLYLLLNIAEKVDVESKMYKMGIVKILCSCLARTNYELVILVVSFLKKLSLFKEAVDEMATRNVVKLLLPLFKLDKEDLLAVTLRLVYNLSFHPELRKSMMSNDLPQILVPFLNDSTKSSFTLRIFYQLTLTDDCKPTIAKSGCLPILMRSILKNVEEQSDLECVAVVINLAVDRTAALLIGEPRGIMMLFKRAFKYRDSLIMKILRNLSEHEELQMRFVDYLRDLASAARLLGNTSKNTSTLKQGLDFSEQQKRMHKLFMREASAMDPSLADFEMESFFGEDSADEDDLDDFSGNEEDFGLECLGLLANLRNRELDFTRILEEFNLLSLIQNLINPKQRRSGDDVLLEAIRLVGTLSLDEKAASIIIKGGVGTQLVELLDARQEDDEILCQILYVFYQFCAHSSTRKLLINETQAPAYLVDLMHDKNREVRRICDPTLDLIVACDDRWASLIQLERFKWHNSQWLEMIEVSEQDRRQAQLGSKASTSKMLNDYYIQSESEDDSENLVMAATLLKDAAAWFSHSAVDRQLSGDLMNDAGTGTAYRDHFEMFYPGTVEEAHYVTASRNPQGDKSDGLTSFGREFLES